jgi:anti-sigma-K factor RskA
MSHHDWSDSVASYLLGALPDHEREGFEEHLHSCAECRAEVDHLRVASDALPNAAIQMAPPPELKDRIMAVVNQEAELLRAAGPEADRAPAADAKPRKRRVVAVLRPGWWSMRPGLALVASMLVLAVGAGGALVAESAINGGTKDVQFAVGSGKLILNEDGHSTLEVSGLEQPAPGHVYQVWLKHKDDADPQPTNALFSGRSDGSASVDVPGSLKNVEQVMVTEEPDGGSTAPTSDPIIVAEPA